MSRVAEAPGRESPYGEAHDRRPGRDMALLAAVVGVGALWLWARPRAGRAGKRRPDMPTLASGRGSHVERTVTVQRRPDEVYWAWRDLERLPPLMRPYLVSVTPVGPGRTRWVVEGPGKVRTSWEAEVTADEPGRLLAWRSVPGAAVDIAGSVRFSAAPGGRGTEVKVILAYAPPAGKLATAVATLVGRDGDRLVREALRRFKQLQETGELATAAPRRELDRDRVTDIPVARSA